MYNQCKLILSLLFLFLLPGFLTADENSQLYKILKKKEIIVSVGGDYEPYYIKNPKPGYPGFEVELASAFAEYLGVTLKEVVPMQTFADHARAIKSGRVDISFGNSSSLKRGQQLGFSDSYYSTSPGALVNKSLLPAESEGQVVTNKIYRKLTDLKSLSGLVIGVKDNTSNLEYVKENFPRVTIKPYLTDEVSFNALNENEINCYVADNLFIEALIQKNPSLKIKMQPVVEPVIEKQLSITMRKNDLELINEANFFIREMKRTGEINRLKAKYFNDNAWVR